MIYLLYLLIAATTMYSLLRLRDDRGAPGRRRCCELRGQISFGLSNSHANSSRDTTLLQLKCSYQLALCLLRDRELAVEKCGDVATTRHRRRISSSSRSSEAT